MLNCATVDFIGDVMWISVRFYRGNRDPDLFPTDTGFGCAALAILLLSTGTCAAAVLVYVVRRNFDEYLDSEKLQSSQFITALLLSFTNPDVVMIFPWKEEAYQKDLVGTQTKSPFPNQDALDASLCRFMEDGPQFLIIVAYVITNGADSFTLANLVFTIIVIIYMVIGKVLVEKLAASEVSFQDQKTKQKVTFKIATLEDETSTSSATSGSDSKFHLHLEYRVNGHHFAITKIEKEPLHDGTCAIKITAPTENFKGQQVESPHGSLKDVEKVMALEKRLKKLKHKNQIARSKSTRIFPALS